MLVKIFAWKNGIFQQVEQLNAYGYQAVNTRFVMNDISLDMLRAEEALFNSQGRRGGGSWKRLKPSTVRKKGATKILFTEGANEGYSKFGNDTLFKSLTVPGAKYQIREIRRDAIEFGTDRPWAGVLEHGSTKKGIPARPFIRFTQLDFERWRKMILDHLIKVKSER